MDNPFEHIILGVFCLVMTLLCAWSSYTDNDKRSNWIETEATILSTIDVTSSEEPGRTWKCVVEYTREDGTRCTSDDVRVHGEMFPGDRLNIIYDPDSDRIQTGGKPQDVTSLNTVFMVAGAAASLFFFVLAGRSILRDCRRQRA